MKKITTAILFTLLAGALTLQAQQNKSVRVLGDTSLEKILPQEMLFHFDNFREATVIREEGVENTVRLNFNLYTRQILYLSSGQQALVLSRPYEVERIKIGDAVWEPVDAGFGELLYYDGTNKLFRVKRTTITDVRREGGFGITSSISATTNVTSHADASGAIEEVLPAGHYDFETRESYRLVVNGRSYSADARGFRNAFPGNNRDIRRFIRDNSIDFDKKEHLLKLIKFCSEL